MFANKVVQSSVTSIHISSTSLRKVTERSRSYQFRITHFWLSPCEGDTWGKYDFSQGRINSTW